MDTLVNLLSLLGALALFLYGMKIMSEGLEKFAGNKLRAILAAMTRNRLMGVLTGILVTALIQSSSATKDDEEYQSDTRLRRYYDATKYMDVNLSYTFGRSSKTTIYAEATNLLNQPLRYYIGGNKDCTTQVEYYGAKVNFGVKFSL